MLKKNFNLLNYNKTNIYKTIILSPVQTKISRNMKKPIGIAGIIYKVLQITPRQAANKIISFIDSSKKTLHVTFFALIVYYIIKFAIFFVPDLYMKNNKTD